MLAHVQPENHTVVVVRCSRTPFEVMTEMCMLIVHSAAERSAVGMPTGLEVDLPTASQGENA